MVRNASHMADDINVGLESTFTALAYRLIQEPQETGDKTAKMYVRVQEQVFRIDVTLVEG